MMYGDIGRRHDRPHGDCGVIGVARICKNPSDGRQVVLGGSGVRNYDGGDVGAGKNRSRRGGRARPYDRGAETRPRSSRGGNTITRLHTAKHNSGGHQKAGERRKSAVRTTDIVTSFVRDSANGKILIVKRSSRVRSMRHMWSGISGVIEGKEEPLTRAKIEIFEETGITEDKLRLVGRTRKMRIDSPQYKNHEWHVFSFLFETHNVEIRLNWENSDYGWIDVDELGSYETVPDLERVLFCLL